MSFTVAIFGPSADGAGPAQAMTISVIAATPNLARIRIAASLPIVSGLVSTLVNPAYFSSPYSTARARAKSIEISGRSLGAHRDPANRRPNLENHSAGLPDRPTDRQDPPVQPPSLPVNPFDRHQRPVEGDWFGFTNGR